MSEISFQEQEALPQQLWRRTKMVVTFGNMTDGKEKEIIEEGVDVARINASHGNQAKHETIIRAIRETDPSVPIMYDLKGPEIRTLDMEGERIIEEGEIVVFSSNELQDEEHYVIRMDHPRMATDLATARLRGNPEDVFINVDNEVDFNIIEIDAERGTVVAQALDRVKIKSRRHVNLIGANISLPSITEEDWKAIHYAAARKLDYVALSFVRIAEDVRKVREYLDAMESPMRIVAKIETRQAVEHIDEIIQAADAIMIARGDLAVEIGKMRLGLVQDEILAKCEAAGKPVITATGVLESMETKRQPSRAESTGIYFAIRDLTHALMLSGEVTNAERPAHTVRTLRQSIEVAESGLPPEQNGDAYRIRRPGRHAKVARSARAWSLPSDFSGAESAEYQAENTVDAIIARTRADFEVVISQVRERPDVPVIAVVPTLEMGRFLRLYRGVVVIPEPEGDMNSAAAADYAIQEGLRLGLLHPGHDVVSIAQIDFRGHQRYSMTELPVIKSE